MEIQQLNGMRKILQGEKETYWIEHFKSTEVFEELFEQSDQDNISKEKIPVDKVVERDDEIVVKFKKEYQDGFFTSVHAQLDKEAEEIIKAELNNGVKNGPMSGEGEGIRYTPDEGYIKDTWVM